MGNARPVVATAEAPRISRGRGAVTVRLLVALTVAYVIGACDGGPRGDPTTGESGAGTSPPADARPAETSAESLKVSVERPRYLAARRMIEVILVNEGGSGVTVETLQLDSPLFEHTEPTRRSGGGVVLDAAQRVDVPVPYGKANCESAPGAEHVRLQVAGKTERLPIIGGRDDLARLREEECNRAAIAAAADIGFGAQWKRVGAPDEYTFQLPLMIRRRGASGARVTIETVAGSVIFSLGTLDPERDPVLVLGADQARASVSVRVRASRCDPHAVAESKKSFRFPMYVALGKAQAQYVEVEAKGAVRRVLERTVAQCAAG